ncbi:hypothetical protein [Agromyces bauzanensis]
MVLLALLIAWGITAYSLLNIGAVQSSAIALLAGGLVVAVSRGARWIPALFLLPAIPYCIGALYASAIGDTLWPFPEHSVYVRASFFMVSTLYVAVGVLVLLGFETAFQRKVTASVDGLIDLSSHPVVRIFAGGTVVVFAIQAWAVVAENGVLTAGRSRRGVEMLLWLGGTLTGQMLAVTATVLALAAFTRMSMLERVIQSLLVVAMWAPFVLGGGRRVLIYAAVPVVIVLFLGGSRLTRRIVALTAIAGLVWFFVVPMAYAGGGDFAANGHGEWSMAAAPFVAQVSGALSVEDVGASGWPSNIVRALPDWLGGASATVLADALAHQTTLYPTGTSGSIWSDIWGPDLVSATIGLIFVFLVIVGIPLLLEGKIPGTLVLATGSFALLGRTHAPYAITTIVVPSIALLGAWMFVRARRSTRPAPSGFVTADPLLTKPAEFS